MRHRVSLSVFCTLCTLFLSSPFAAQGRLPQRDADALIVLQRAVSAMGGTAVGQVQDCVAQGIWDAPEGSPLMSGDFVWKTSGSESRYDNPGRSGRAVFVSGRGRPAIVKSEGAVQYHAHVSEAMFPPHLPTQVLLRLLADSRYKLVFVGQEVRDGRMVFRVRSSLETDEVSAAVSVQDWFLDGLTGLPLRVEYRMPANSNALEYLPAAIDFSNYQFVSGVAVPFQITFSEDGQITHVAKLSSIVFNSGVSPSEFDAPVGGAR